MTRVAWTDPAVIDLHHIHEYIAQDSDVYADAVIQEMFDAIDRL